jgi:RNA polymerase sigma-70 factor, ECF subfamily
MVKSDTDDQQLQILEEGRQLQEFVRELTVSQGRIRAFIVSMMPGSPDVADVLQETNLTLWKSRERYEPGTNFMAWALTVARLEVLHQRDRSKRLGRLVLSEKLMDVLADEAPEHPPHETYLAALETCMSKLSVTQREIIEARYQPKLSLEIHARLTGRNAGALRAALLRIRYVLRECIESSIQSKTA